MRVAMAASTRVGAVPANVGPSTQRPSIMTGRIPRRSSTPASSASSAFGSLSEGTNEASAAPVSPRGRPLERSSPGPQRIVVVGDAGVGSTRSTGQQHALAMCQVTRHAAPRPESPDERGGAPRPPRADAQIGPAQPNGSSGSPRPVNELPCGTVDAVQGGMEGRELRRSRQLPSVAAGGSPTRRASVGSTPTSSLDGGREAPVLLLLSSTVPSAAARAPEQRVAAGSLATRAPASAEWRPPRRDRRAARRAPSHPPPRIDADIEGPAASKMSASARWAPGRRHGNHPSGPEGVEGYVARSRRWGSVGETTRSARASSRTRRRFERALRRLDRATPSGRSGHSRSASVDRDQGRPGSTAR
jgi:hypothetical protein